MCRAIRGRTVNVSLVATTPAATMAEHFASRCRRAFRCITVDASSPVYACTPLWGPHLEGGRVSVVWWYPEGGGVHTTLDFRDTNHPVMLAGGLFVGDPDLDGHVLDIEGPACTVTISQTLVLDYDVHQILRWIAQTNVDPTSEPDPYRFALGRKAPCADALIDCDKFTAKYASEYAEIPGDDSE